MTRTRRTRIKICGITRAEDAEAAALLGADAIGLVFVPESPRAVDAECARVVLGRLPPLVSSVGLFRNAEPAEVRAVLAAVPLAWLQFHGDETPDYCAAFGRPYIKAVPMGAGAAVEDYAARFVSAAALLLDSHGDAKIGGSGEAFDWDRIPAACTKPLILAGGLGPDNVEAAVRRVRPWAVDVSSGVEAAKGIKDPLRLAAFIRGVENADRG